MPLFPVRIQEKTVTSDAHDRMCIGSAECGERPAASRRNDSYLAGRVRRAWKGKGNDAKLGTGRSALGFLFGGLSECSIHSASCQFAALRADLVGLSCRSSAGAKRARAASALPPMPATPPRHSRSSRHHHVTHEHRVAHQSHRSHKRISHRQKLRHAGRHRAAVDRSAREKKILRRCKRMSRRQMLRSTMCRKIMHRDHHVASRHHHHHHHHHHRSTASIRHHHKPISHRRRVRHHRAR